MDTTSRFDFDKEKQVVHGEGEDEVFERYLQRKGLKFTTARKELLSRIFEMHDHFTADQLLERLKETPARVSKATVYRTLAVMLDCGLLEAHDFGEGALYYEHMHGHPHHDHMFCVRCKRIIEFRSEEIEALQEGISRDMGFKMHSHSLKLFGTCADCRGDG